MSWTVTGPYLTVEKIFPQKSFPHALRVSLSSSMVVSLITLFVLKMYFLSQHKREQWRGICLPDSIHEIKHNGLVTWCFDILRIMLGKLDVWTTRGQFYLILIICGSLSQDGVLRLTMELGLCLTIYILINVFISSRGCLVPEAFKIV